MSIKPFFLFSFLFFSFLFFSFFPTLSARSNTRTTRSHAYLSASPSTSAPLPRVAPGHGPAAVPHFHARAGFALHAGSLLHTRRPYTCAPRAPATHAWTPALPPRMRLRALQLRPHPRALPRPAILIVRGKLDTSARAPPQHRRAASASTLDEFCAASCTP
jgi:hypothetical protein